jgi:hypothetical protein
LFFRELEGPYLLDRFQRAPFLLKVKFGFAFSALSVLSLFVEAVFGSPSSVFNSFFVLWLFYALLCFPGWLSAFMLCVYGCFFYLYCSFIGFAVRIALSFSLIP